MTEEPEDEQAEIRARSRAAFDARNEALKVEAERAEEPQEGE